MDGLSSDQERERTEYVCGECNKVWDCELKALECEQQDRLKKIDKEIYDYFSGIECTRSTRYVKYCIGCDKKLIEYSIEEDGDRSHPGAPTYYDKRFVSFYVNRVFGYRLCLGCLISKGGAKILFDLERLGYKEFLERNVRP